MIIILEKSMKLGLKVANSSHTVPKVCEVIVQEWIVWGLAITGGNHQI
jgi:hypothetical protein